MRIARFLALWLFAGAFALAPIVASLPTQSEANSTRPDVVGTQIGGYTVSQGSSWSTLTSASFFDMTSTAGVAAALPASRYFTEVHACNTHATQTLYLALAALNGVIPGTANRIPVGPGACKTIPVYGVWTLSISIYGSGAATTGHILAQFVSSK